MIRIDSIWLATTPLDMRAGTDTTLARVVAVFGCARPHHAYLFANRRSNRMKVLVHDGFGIWLCARRLHRGHFTWAHTAAGLQVSLTREQLDALTVGLPWQQLGDAGVILEKIDRDHREISFKDAQISKLTFEIAHLKRIQYGRLSEKLSGEQKSLFDEAVESDLAALEQTLSDPPPACWPR